VAHGGEESGLELVGPFGACAGEIEVVLAALALADVPGDGNDRGGVRIDGLLETDDGGYSAWGYVVGRERGGPLPRAIELAGPVSVVADETGRIELRCPLRPV